MLLFGKSSKNWTVSTSFFFKILRSFHDGIKAGVNFVGMLTGTIKFENAIKHGDFLASTLYSISFLFALLDAFGDCIMVLCQRTGRLASFSAYVGLHKRQNFFFLVFFLILLSNLLYDCDLVAQRIQHAQKFMD